jgi:hypothetical protein
MKKLSKAHKEAIRKGMLKAAKEGRLRPPSRAVINAGLQAISNMSEEKVSQRCQLAGETMRGRPQRIDVCVAAKEDNIHAKNWELISPDKKKYTVKNINNFIRDNEHLFHPDDVIWTKSHCRASVGLHSLNQINKKTGRPRALSWKGWVGNSI